jgi:cell division transport system ATP-binding protein
MITAQGVTKKFGDIIALSEVSFTVTPGEFVFLTGPSGSGKTTLFKLLTRELLPDAGSIIIDNQDLTKLKSPQLPKLRRQIGVVYQDFRLLPDRSVEENVAIPLQIRHTNHQNIQPAVLQALETVGLASRAKLFPSQLSGGELQRVGIARAIVASPKLILADEPTGNLDPRTSKGIVTLIKHIQEELKTTVIMATHNADIVNKFSQRVLQLENGKLVKDTPTGKYES